MAVAIPCLLKGGMDCLIKRPSTKDALYCVLFLCLILVAGFKGQVVYTIL